MYYCNNKIKNSEPFFCGVAVTEETSDFPIEATSDDELIFLTHCVGKDPTLHSFLPLHHPDSPISIIDTISPTFEWKILKY